MLTGELSTPVGMSGEMYRGVGSTDYNDLENKPTYNGHIIEGDLTSEALGIFEPFNITTTEKKTGFKYNGKDIYVKTFNNLNLSIPANGTWIYTGCYIDNLETILSFNVNDGTNCWNPILLYASPQLIIASGFAFTARNIILYYIKVGD